MRWVDDVVHVVNYRNLSGAARRVLRALSQVQAYGPGLRLLRTAGHEAFGFRWWTEQGRLYVAQDEKWVRSFNNQIGRRGRLSPDEHY